jgi:hypothetical protein
VQKANIALPTPACLNSVEAQKISVVFLNFAYRKSMKYQNFHALLASNCRFDQCCYLCLRQDKNLAIAQNL